MQKHQLYINLLALSSALALAACADKGGVEDVVTPPAPEPEPEPVFVKTPIEFTVGTSGLEAITRIVTSNDANAKSFSERTSLYMLMKSQDKDDEAKSLVTRTIMFAEPQTDGSKNYSDVNYSASNEEAYFVRYWDDSYARSSLLSVLAVCTPGMGPNSTTPDKKTWIIGTSSSYQNQGWTAPSSTTTDYPSVSWPIGKQEEVTNYQFKTDQSIETNGVNFIKNQDLCFSNNIGHLSTADNRMKFDFTEKKFESKKMIFYHALSKLTFRFTKTSAFNDQDFKFATGTNIKLSNFYNEGTFKLEDGVFDVATLEKDSPIEKIYEHPSLTTEETSANIKMVLDALVIPGTLMTSDDKAVTFTIANNEYNLSMKQLYNAFTNAQKELFFDGGKLKAGVNYVFTFNVDKTTIKSITASIVDWSTVEVYDSPSNARIKLNVEERGTLQSGNVDFYRKADNKTSEGINDEWTVYDWVKGYEKATSPTYNTDHFDTGWVWDSNKHFYHFRALMPINTTTELNADGGDYAKLVSAVSNYDVCWGAPMLDDAEDETPSPTLKWSYSLVSGFDGNDPAKHQIYKAIGPTEDQIKLILFHAMSEVTFTITTSTDEKDKVDLGNGSTSKTQVKLEGFYPNGQILLGNGLVKTSGDKSAATAIEQNSFSAAVAASGDTPAKAANAKFVYGVVPQDLTGVQLRIITPDNNEYLVPLNNLETAVENVSNNNIVNPYTVTGEKVKIDRWYPNFKYNYTFTLKKKGMADFTVTVLNWEEVSAEVDNVQIQ